MTLIVCMQLTIVLSIVYASRHRLEDALPVFCFFLVLMPLEARLVIPGLFDLTTMRISLLTLLMLYLIRGEPASSEPLPLKYLMIMHVSWAALSTIYSLSFTTSAKQLLSQVMEFYLLYFLLVRIITSVKTIHNILFAACMAMGVCCILAISESSAHWSILRIFPSNLWITYNGGVDPIYIEWGRGLRVRSTFPHPILFGDALAMSIPLTLYLLSIWEEQRKRLLLWTGLILMFWAIYRTSSRGPWIATGFCSVLLFLLIRNRIRKYILAIGFATLIVLLARPGIWATIDGLYSASTDTNTPVGTSYLYRDALNHAVRDAVAKNPTRALLGYGLGTFRELGLEIRFLGRAKRWFTCDNNWASFLYETGYGGLFLIGALLFKALWIAFQNYLHLPEPENLLDGVLFICLAGFYFLLLSVAGYSWGQQGYLAWILISLVVSHPRVALENESEDSESGDLLEEQQNPISEEEYDFSAA
ncbi:O-antigen ligase family protein [Edaphobacter paludis]|uniref:O-antigen ligase family protein n=1 Tax=Edaphobacter paludis TaxID=3035702 RepID=A0AAU7CVR6_9BACT